MRTLPSRKPLGEKLLSKLAAETAAITGSADAKTEAATRYGRARKAKWFEPVVKTLCELAGPGRRCMFCSGSESSDVEHYRPKAVHPELAMEWENYLWSCTPCNRGKSNRFPPETEDGGLLINPLDENVWDFFFIDDYGLLTPRFDSEAGVPDERAVSTRDLLSLNREAVHESRLMRLRNLRQQVTDTFGLLKQRKLSKGEARERLETWKLEPWQPDVASYFLSGPGKDRSPFKEFLAAI